MALKIKIWPTENNERGLPRVGQYQKADGYNIEALE